MPVKWLNYDVIRVSWHSFRTQTRACDPWKGMWLYFLLFHWIGSYPWTALVLRQWHVILTSDSWAGLWDPTGCFIIKRPCRLVILFPKGIKGALFCLEYIIILSLDYNLHCHGDQITQNAVFAPEFPFQHTSNFDFYLPGKFDFIYLDAPTNHYAVLHSNLTSSYWESLKMKGRYILFAAHNWNGSSATEPLPISVPDKKLQEISMIPPPFLPLHQLTYNFLLLLESPEVIKGWIKA